MEENQFQNFSEFLRHMEEKFKEFQRLAEMEARASQVLTGQNGQYLVHLN